MCQQLITVYVIVALMFYADVGWLASPATGFAQKFKIPH
jgi:hypothetical protein